MEKKCAFPWQNNKGCNAWEWKKNVVGCGLLLDPDNKWSIFFTINGRHWGQLYIYVIEIQTSFKNIKFI
jgi:hypothetical protein